MHMGTEFSPQMMSHSTLTAMLEARLAKAQKSYYLLATRVVVIN